ncbi:MAG: FtsX-like permease family protein [Phycisphaeraceae bacterium]|nr:MAG: FtsX-like permease family protein [Phycisphaeraceae bacterium]
MSAPWRLATSSLSGRRLRTGLLVAAVALATGLVVVVACGVASVNATMQQRVHAAVGAADVNIEHVGGRAFDEAMIERARAWPGVRLAAGRSRGAVPLMNVLASATAVAAGIGIDPEVEYELRPPALIEGREVRADGEIALDVRLAEELQVVVGDELDVQRFGDPIRLVVVGLNAPPPLGAYTRPEATLTRETLATITGERGRVREVGLVLERGVDAEEFAERMQQEAPESLAFNPTVRISSGLDRNLRSSNIGLTLVSALAFMAAGFIILTGMTTNVQERQRELAIVRCLGGSRGQIAGSQLFVGLMIGAMGALAGLPFGVGLAWIASIIFSEQLTSGLRIAWGGMGLAAAGAIGAGLLASVWPAFSASRTSPLDALSVRARPTLRRHIVIAGCLGLAMAAAQVAIVSAPNDGQTIFWLHALIGAPLMFVGYFLMATPVSMLVSRTLGPAMTWLLRLPPGVLTQAARATPFRHGFTAGSLMAGLALMVVIWTEGSAVLRDWVGGIAFPDAFVHGITGLSAEQRRSIDALPFVVDTCAITLMRVEDESFGVRALRPIGTTFIAFEPEPFFRMTRIEWIEGDPEAAIAKLHRGGAIMIAREFKVARELGVGDTFPITHRGVTHDFEIVGVVGSPGLELVSRYFDIGAERQEQSLHAVFGTRQDMVRLFGNDAIQLVQIDLSEDIGDEEALAAIRRALGPTLLTAGSGREIKGQITRIGRNSMRIMSWVAVAAIVIACFGVGNIVVASIDARRFEFGVLRAVGADGTLLSRMVIGETALIALAACVVGTVLGVQGSWTGLLLYRELAGLELSLRPPVIPIAAGWGILITLTLAAAAPAAIAVSRKRPRELLAAVKG